MNTAQRPFSNHQSTTTMFARILPIALVLLAACTSPSSAPPRATGGPLVVPASGEDYLVFRADAVERRSEGAAPETTPVPPGSGKPAAAGVDAMEAQAGVAYENALAIVQLIDGSIEWSASPPEWSGTPGRMAISGKYAMTVAGNRAALYTFLDGKRIWQQDVGSFLSEKGLDDLYYALPITPEQFLLVGHRAYSFGGNARTFVFKVDRSGGKWVALHEQQVSELSGIGDCASNGEFLYVAGIREESTPGAVMMQGQLLQRLVVLRIDPTTMLKTEVVNEDRGAEELAVRQIIAGDDLLVVILQNGHLLVYRVSENGVGARIYDRRVPGEFSVGWIGMDRIVLLRSGDPEVLRMR